MKSLNDIRSVYCIGLGGVGVSAVAKIFLSRGIKVSGSDPVVSPVVTDVVKLGGTHFLDESPDHLTKDVNLVVTTDDAPLDHPLRLAAEQLGIPVENFSVTLNRLMTESPKRLCIAGTNGKSTTTALTGLLMADAGQDPKVFIGSRVTEFDGNTRLGQGKSFVAEADEYHDHFLNYEPTVITLTNIEPDHLDYFKTEAKMLESFSKFVAKLPEDGILVANANDAQVMKIAESVERVITFGIHQEADLRAVDIKQADGQQTWTTMWNGDNLGTFTLHIPGEFNIMNALAAMAGALALGADPLTFATTMNSFHGIWRRFQILNPGAPITIISDYAHHPTAVQVTLDGAKKFYPGRRIVAVFQPHHRSRLTALFADFAKSFISADEVMIVETYSVPGRDVPEAQSKTSVELVAALKNAKINAVFAKNPSDAEEQLKKILRPGDVVIIMGAGDIWRNAEQLGEYYV